MKITEREKEILDELLQRQNYHAFSLGIVETEYQKARSKILACFPLPIPDLHALGAMVWEHHQQQKFWLSKISDTESKQKAAGEEILNRHGIDFNKGDYRIQDGIIYVLREGVYIAFERG